MNEHEKETAKDMFAVRASDQSADLFTNSLPDSTQTPVVPDAAIETPAPTVKPPAPAVTAAAIAAPSWEIELDLRGSTRDKIYMFALCSLLVPGLISCLASGASMASAIAHAKSITDLSVLLPLFFVACLALSLA